MLNKIYIENINSIGECVIDFKKNSYKFRQENVIEDNINPVAIYGHNGSGKSSIVKSIGSLIALLIGPVDLLQPFTINNLNYEAYRKNKKKDFIEGKIVLYFDVDNNKYEYTMVTSLSRYIEEEMLKCNNKVIIERNKTSYIYLEHKNQIVDSFMVPTLRKLANIEINDKIIQEAYQFLSSMTLIDLTRINSTFGFVTSKLFETTSKFDLLVSKSNEVKEILKDYKEFPIYDIVKTEQQIPNGLINPELQYQIELEGDNEKIRLPYSMISSGMQSQSLLLSILLSIPNNAVLFIDDLDENLYSSTIKSFLHFVRKKKIQLLFAANNTNILQDLRPDQIYLSKWVNGYSKCDRLSDVYPNIREINNIEKMYLSGVFDE